MRKEVELKYSCPHLMTRVVKVNDNVGVEITAKILMDITIEHGEDKVFINHYCEFPNFILLPNISFEAQVDAFLNALENKYGAPIERTYLNTQFKYLEHYDVDPGWEDDFL